MFSEQWVAWLGGYSDSIMRALIGSQMAVALTTVIIMLYRGSADAMLAVLYGASIGILVTLLVRRSTDKALEKAVDSPQQGIIALFSGLVLRYAVVILGLLIGLKILKLMTVSVLIGFVSVMIVWIFASHWVKS